MASLKNSQLRFLSGLQTTLEAMTTSEVGTFYLTSDTHRLYIGEGGKPVAVNQGIKEIANTNDLPAAKENAGQFCYITDDNILAISNGQSWIQINTDTTLKESSDSVSVSAKSEGAVTIETLVQDTNGNQSAGDFQIAEGAGVTLTVDGNKITIASNGAGGAVVDLSLESAEENKQVNFAAKTTVTAADGTITESTDKVSLKAGKNVDSIEVVDDVATINAATQEVKTLAFDNLTEGFDLILTQTSGADVTASTATKLDPVITIGQSDATSDIKFKSGKATLDVYTIAQADTKIENEIAAKLRAADAMTFKGVVNTAGELPAITDAANGDTYKVGTAGTYVGKAAKVGDLFIANGTEDESTGKITTGTWEYVPSANEYETKVKSIEHGIQITDDAEDSTILGSIALEAGKQIVLTDEGSEQKVVNVAHADITTATNTDAPTATTEYAAQTNKVGRTKDITVVKSITVDNGHVTNVETAKETIEDTTLETLETSYSVADGKASIETVLTDTKGNSVTQNLAIESDTLTLTVDNNNAVKAELLWGSF